MAEARRLAQLRAETPRPLMIALLVDDAGYARWLCEQGRGCVDLALCPDSSWGVKARPEGTGPWVWRGSDGFERCVFESGVSMSRMHIGRFDPISCFSNRCWAYEGP